ncbi:MAG: deaminase [Desulfuromonas sp.]|nr:MAG: deaminase [Desulfuromonas sp.]
MNAASRTKVSVFIATSLDGFIARPDGGIDWLMNAGEDAEDCGYKEFFDSVDALVMGRNSFEKVLEFDHWPYQEKPVVVLSKSLTEMPDNLRGLVKIDSSSPEELIEKLSLDGSKRIYLDGGNVIQSFLRAGLVDDITLTKIPVLIGQGRPLFGELQYDIKLQHLSTQSWDNGFVQSSYEVVGS